MTKKILVADDSRMSRMMIRAIINSRYPEWEIFEAGDGETALKMSEATTIDMATLDYNMPGMDGIDLGIQLRKQFPDAQLTMLTANVQEAARQKAEAAGIGFIGKPVTEEKILGFIETGVEA